jgi:hypothetical protein
MSDLDTWTRDAEIDPDAPVAYVLTREGEVVAAGIVVREPEAGS